MKPRERRETGEEDLFRAKLDLIIDKSHELVKLTLTIDWRFGQLALIKHQRYANPSRFINPGAVEPSSQLLGRALSFETIASGPSRRVASDSNSLAIMR